jgi:formate hydrogenlyase subunit 3/multisubunit Na+/H+ antiporter MnhD subunit
MEIAAIIFILLMLAVAYITFRLLKKTVKMAIRAMIVLLILAVMLVGGIALWSMSGEGDSDAPRPAKTKRSR